MSKNDLNRIGDQIRHLLPSHKFEIRPDRFGNDEIVFYSSYEWTSYDRFDKPELRTSYTYYETITFNAPEDSYICALDNARNEVKVALEKIKEVRVYYVTSPEQRRKQQEEIAQKKSTSIFGAVIAFLSMFLPPIACVTFAMDPAGTGIGAWFIPLGAFGVIMFLIGSIVWLVNKQ